MILRKYKAPKCYCYHVCCIKNIIGDPKTCMPTNNMAPSAFFFNFPTTFIGGWLRMKMTPIRFIHLNREMVSATCSKKHSLYPIPSDKGYELLWQKNQTMALIQQVKFNHLLNINLKSTQISSKSILTGIPNSPLTWMEFLQNDWEQKAKHVLKGPDLMHIKSRENPIAFSNKVLAWTWSILLYCSLI